MFAKKHSAFSLRQLCIFLQSFTECLCHWFQHRKQQDKPGSMYSMLLYAKQQKVKIIQTKIYHYELQNITSTKCVNILTQFLHPCCAKKSIYFTKKHIHNLQRIQPPPTSRKLLIFLTTPTIVTPMIRAYDQGKNVVLQVSTQYSVVSMVNGSGQSQVNSCSYIAARASIPMGQGGTCPPNISEVMSFRMSTRVTATVVSCILMQILCAVSQKSFSFWGTQTPYRGSAPGPQPPDSQSPFMSPSIIL